MIGWLANALMLYGSFAVGNHCRYGFLFQLVGNFCWLYIGCYRMKGKDRASLIGISAAFCLLYCWNFLKWGNEL